jgi:hypothetical protein
MIFSVVLVAFCGTSYLEVVKSRDDQLPTKGDFLAALLPLACIPALLSLCCGMVKWKDDCWILSRGVYVFFSIGLLLLFGAIAAVIAVKPWTVNANCLHNSQSFWLTFLNLIHLCVSIITDRRIFSLSSFPYGGNNWCNPSLGVKQFLFNQETDILCLLSCSSFGFGRIPSRMASR